VKATYETIAVGQVYESTRERDRGRRVRVVEIVGLNLRQARVVNVITGRETWIYAERLTRRTPPGRQGWRLIEEEKTK